MTIEYIVGVDPGNAGALALLKKVNNTVEVVKLVPMPTKKVLMLYKKGEKELTRIDEVKLVTLLKEWKSKYNISRVVLEEQTTYRGQNITAIGTTLEQYGVIRGILAALDFSCDILQPDYWQGLYPKVEIPPEVESLKLDLTKKVSIALVMNLFPEANLFRTPKCKKPNDAFSDAILIGNSFYLRSQNRESATM